MRGDKRIETEINGDDLVGFRQRFVRHIIAGKDEVKSISFTFDRNLLYLAFPFTMPFDFDFARNAEYMQFVVIEELHTARTFEFGLWKNDGSKTISRLETRKAWFICALLDST